MAASAKSAPSPASATTTGRDQPALSARERILTTAHALFYRDGLRATGIDRLIAESGVAKLTFYRHFPSKDVLIRTFLEERHERWMAWFVDALGRHGAMSGAGLAPLRPALAEWFEEPSFRGCAFINALAEAGGAIDDVALMAHRHKQDMRQVITELLPAVPGQAALASAAALAVDGAIVRAQIEGAASALAALEPLLMALDLSSRVPRQPSPHQSGRRQAVHHQKVST